MGTSRTVLLRMVDERKTVEEDLSYIDRGLETLRRFKSVKFHSWDSISDLYRNGGWKDPKL